MPTATPSSPTDGKPGEYYNRRRAGRTSKAAYDPGIVRRHGDLSARLPGITW